MNLVGGIFIKSKLFIMCLTSLMVLLSFNLTVQVEAKALSPFNFVAESFIRGYQDYVSPITYSSCPMHPSCSNFAVQSFRRDSFFKALLQTTDRLFRCENDLDHYEQIRVEGKIRFKDELTADGNYTGEVIPEFAKEENLEIREPEKYLYNFALELESEGKFEKALTEYRRFLSYYPDSFYRGEVSRAIIRLLLEKERFKEVREEAITLLHSEDSELVNQEELKYIIGYSYLKTDSLDMAREYLKKISHDHNLKSKAYLLRGFTYVQEDNLQEARNQFKQIETSSPYFEQAQSSIELTKKGEELNYKNPWLAAGLSVVPGLGYLYSGHKETALSSFLINGLLFSGTKKAFDNNNKALGTLVGVFSLAFYSGNIYGAYRTAEDYNQRLRQEYLMGFKFEF